MQSSKKLTLTITLDGWEEKLIRRAHEICFPKHFQEENIRRDFRRLLRMALWAFTRAVINEGFSPICPVGMGLRHETQQELKDRVDEKFPGRRGAGGIENPVVAKSNAGGPADARKTVTYKCVELTEIELNALSWIQRECLLKSEKPEGLVWAVLITSLAYPRTLRAMVNSIKHYSFAEGFGCDLTELLLARIQQCPEYQNSPARKR